MRAWILRRSPRGEFLLVTLIAFTFVIMNSVAALLLKMRRVEVTTGSLVQMLLIELAILLVVCWILRVRGRSIADLGMRFSLGGLLSGIPLTIAYLFLYWFTALTVASFAPALGRIDIFRMTWHAPTALILLMLVVNSVFEEFLVTGYVVTALAGDGPAYAISASNLIRFLYQVYQGPVAAISILPMGILFGIVYWRSRSLWPLMVAHTLVNVLGVLVWGRQQA
ncbi:MAG: protease self-immunity family protein [Acidobacteria bacterium]|nr:protease self-immunity family protein [Acidobacteriota bacterium]